MNTYPVNNGRAESQLVWNYLIATFNPSVIVPFVYIGTTVAHELLTYAANKLYFALDYYYSCSSPNVNTNSAMVTFYNSANAAYLYASNVNMNWDTTAAVMKYSRNGGLVQDVYFSRVVTSDYTFVKFIGYKLTLP